MKPRMDMIKVVPQAYQAVMGLETYVREHVDHTLLELVKLRASMLNGCAFCVDMHSRDALAAGESTRRLFAVSAWREAPFFNERERAALELTEAVTRLGEDGVPDAERVEDHQVLLGLRLPALVGGDHEQHGDPARAAGPGRRGGVLWLVRAGGVRGGGRSGGPGCLGRPCRPGGPGLPVLVRPGRPGCLARLGLRVLLGRLDRRGRPGLLGRPALLVLLVLLVLPRRTVGAGAVGRGLCPLGPGRPAGHGAPARPLLLVPCCVRGVRRTDDALRLCHVSPST